MVRSASEHGKGLGGAKRGRDVERCLVEMVDTVVVNGGLLG